MNMFTTSFAGLSAVGVLTVMSGCSGVSEVTKQRVAHSGTVVQQAQQTIGTSEAGATDLQHAREKQNAASQAVDQNKSKDAERFASQAQLTAELAIAKSQSAQARKAADELTASTETLRQEADRNLDKSR
jgi:predicted  nucleic acid-binding Zn-ribbon protein